MLYYLGKILQPLAWPFNLFLILCGLGYLFYYRSNFKWASRVVLAAFVILLFFSLELTSRFLVFQLESQYVTLPVADYPEVQAIIVLGGTVAYQQAPRPEPEEIFGSRVQTAARLYLAGKAPIIIVSGGPKYESFNGGTRSEADDMALLLTWFGVPAENIVKEAKSRNTLESARETGRILAARSIDRVLLVTDAFHMPRSMYLYNLAGVRPVPVPTGKKTTDGFELSYLLPDAGSLASSTSAIKEWVGFTVYRLLSPKLD